MLWLEKSIKGVDRKKHRNATFTMFLVLGSADLSFVIAYRQQIVGGVTAKYLQKFD